MNDFFDKNSKLSGPEVKSVVGNGPKKVNLLEAGRKKSGSFWKYLLLGFFLLFVAVFIVIGARAANLTNKIFVGNKTTFIQKIKSLIFNSNNNVLGSNDPNKQINILLLGIGGEGHDGPYLTDTMILMQIRPEDNEVVMTSIPRDLLVNLPDNLGQQKINAAFAQGFVLHHDWNEAGDWARQQVEKLSGLDIPYFAVLDFSGFKTAVDTIGGVDVTVDRTFTDYSYPNDATNGYLPPLTFTAGPQHMNGTTALEFARSRHAAGFEGSDFARSLRQQKIINAIKSKTLSLNLITDSGKLNSLLGILADHFHTNLSPTDLYDLFQIFKDRNLYNFLSLSLDPTTQLICPEILPTNGAYVLVACPGKTDTDIENFFKNAFARARLSQENSVIWLATSTGDKAAYQKAYAILQNQGLTVWELPYKTDPLPKTIFYLVNPKPATAEFLTNELSAQQVTLPPPQVNVDKSKVDVIVILGQDYSSTTPDLENN